MDMKKKKGHKIYFVKWLIFFVCRWTPSTEFSELYRYTFELCRETKAKKVVDKNIALGMFQLVLGENPPHHVAPLCAFLEKKADLNVLNIDQWSCMLDFVATVAPDFSNYSSDEAWPGILDDYVEETQKQQQ